MVGLLGQACSDNGIRNTEYGQQEIRFVLGYIDYWVKPVLVMEYRKRITENKVCFR